MPRTTFTTTILLILATLLTRCNQGTISEEINDTYLYVENGDSSQALLSTKHGINIYATVTEYKYNNNIIIALQNPNFKQHKTLLAFNLRVNNRGAYPENSKEDIRESERIADSILRNDPYYLKIFSHNKNYWIVLCKENQTFGPLTKEEYKLKRKELSVPGSLQLSE